MVTASKGGSLARERRWCSGWVSDDRTRRASSAGGELMAGRRHVFEAEMKERRRTVDHTGHESRSPLAHHPTVVTEARSASERRQQT